MLEVAGRYFWAGLASERGVSIAEDRGVERQRSTRAVLLDVVTETEGDHGTWRERVRAVAEDGVAGTRGGE